MTDFTTTIETMDQARSVVASLKEANVALTRELQSLRVAYIGASGKIDELKALAQGVFDGWWAGEVIVKRMHALNDWLKEHRQ